MFKDLCPHLYNETNTATCCDKAQLTRFNSDLSVPRQLMSRCPACFTNFKAFLCDMTCSPTNAQFLLVTSEQPYNPTTTNDSNNKHEDVVHDDTEDPEEEEHEKLTVKRRKKRSAEIESKDLPIPTMEIVSVTYHLTHMYANNLYNSCRYIYTFF